MLMTATRYRRNRKVLTVSLSEEQARRIAEQAVEQAGGARQVYMNPRHPFAPNANRKYEIEGHKVTVRFGESTSPAIVEIGSFVYEIQIEGLVKLFGPDA
jgi:hypothetical protein